MYYSRCTSAFGSKNCPGKRSSFLYTNSVHVVFGSSFYAKQTLKKWVTKLLSNHSFRNNVVHFSIDARITRSLHWQLVIKCYESRYIYYLDRRQLVMGFCPRFPVDYRLLKLSNEVDLPKLPMNGFLLLLIKVLY